MADTFLNNIDVDKLNSLFKQTSDNVEYFNATSAEVIKIGRAHV